MKRLICVVAAVSAACSCPGKPATETPPANLGEKGFVVEQPAEDGAVTGAWITVAGWFDPKVVRAVYVVGAPVDAFYLPTGHVGVPTVPVTIRSDGRFFAPRVPLQDGTTTVYVVPNLVSGERVEPLTRTLTVTDAANVPATLVIDPPQPEPNQTAKLRAATGESASASWQWDFEGDGTFDAESTSASHAFPNAGTFEVIARTKVDGRWVSAWARVAVGTLPAATATATSVAAPSRLFAIPKFAAPPLETGPDGLLSAETTATRYVAAIDGDLVHVFDASLAPLFTLQGLSRPSMVAGDDQGRLYVADTGHDRISRFTSSGALDTTFATAGSFTGTADVPLAKPVALAVGPSSAEIMLEEGKRVVCTEDNGAMGDWAAVSCSSVALTDSTSFNRLGMATLTHGVTRPRVLFDSITGTLAFFVVNSKLVSAGFRQYVTDDTMKDVVDVAVGPTVTYEDMLVVDTRGRVHQHRMGARIATWQLGYEATCVAAGADGKVYVGGPGRIEARAFEVLR